jgi:hypothetical protein
VLWELRGGMAGQGGRRSRAARGGKWWLLLLLLGCLIAAGGRHSEAAAAAAATRELQRARWLALAAAPPCSSLPCPVLWLLLLLLFL